MPGSGTWIFVDPDDFQARLRRAHVDLLLTDRGEFKARLTWASLHHVYVLRVEEAPTRVAYVSLPAAWSFVAFTEPTSSPLLWNGMPLTAHDIVMHGCGERFYQRTTGPSIWTLLVLAPARLEKYAATLSGRPLLTSANSGRVLRPSMRSLARLRRLCMQVCRLAEHNSKVLAHPEVARALEDDLIRILVNCLDPVRA